MLLDANKVEQFLDTKGEGAKARVGYDLTLKGVKQIKGGVCCNHANIHFKREV